MAALKIAAVCVLLLFVGSDLARCVASSASPGDEDQAAAGALLLREFLELELSLLAEQHGGVGEFCPPACQNCLIICGITCVLNPNPATCFVNCTTANGCFSKTLPVVA
ncbi:uncharacterized protein [Zea mays]|jgi:hypothetical protein|uniref:Uncharacterized protein n=1 Tax=Zea mays TaxID=4577 RepID=B6TFV3_MAIZE|nr:uncharacterized protein LOC100276642 precursor [Zea mays]XP_020396004.1 uncharacterized protein LOC100276642 isoform X1 [Zea mays]ACG35986.1 hypothetical protein [Zea mays]ONM55020.1 hypothetical protein ZEAMMB73_Zm00001d020504 [Zea mays]|eukprot:NP_001143851.1 uncharacterized protein LOC100276642 precursor [Zea mays]